MNLRQLRSFVVIADAGGFARAENQLHLSQPAASRQVQALEAEFGVPLFDRIGRRMQLTAEGEDLLKLSRRLLHDAESIGERARALREGQTGTLRVAASTQHIETVLADFLPHYRGRHPGVDVDLIEGGGARLPEHLERGDVHMALVTVESDRYHRRLLAPVYAMAVMKKTHPLSGKSFLDIKNLEEDRLLLLSRDFASRGWFDTACRVSNIRPRVILQSAAPQTLIALARTGEGIAIVPSNVQIPSKVVRAIPLVSGRSAIGRWACVAWDPQRFLAPYAKQFADELIAYCRRHYPNRELVRRAPSLTRPKETARH